MRALMCVGLIGLVGQLSVMADTQIVTAWGENNSGQLGLGMQSPYSYYAPERVPAGIFPDTLTNVSQISCGGFHVLALRDNQTVLAWGNGMFGQLGQGPLDLNNKDYATIVPGVSNIHAVTCGGNHSIALTSANTLIVWGNNASGQLGLGDRIPRPTPNALSGLNNIDSVYCGANFTLVLMADSTVMAFGNNAANQLGFEATNSILSPVAIPNLTNVISMSCGTSHAIALMEDGTVKAWGNNFFGQLGLGDTTNRYEPTTVPGLASVAEVVCGGFHTIVRMNDGSLRSFGQNTLGQLGVGDHTNHYAAVVVSNISSATEIAAGEDFSMAVMADSRVMSWGGNTEGQLGQGTILTITNPAPAYLPALARMTNIACGNLFAFAVGAETPVLSVTPDYLDYGHVDINNTVADQFWVKNIGFGYLDVDASVSSPFNVLSESVPLYDSESGLVVIQFTPTEPLAYSNIVTFTGGWQPVERYVLGQGWAPHFYLKWESTNGALYDVTVGTNLLDSSYEMFRTNIVATPPSNQLVWTNLNSEEQLFFRIESNSNYFYRIQEFEFIRTHD